MNIDKVVVWSLIFLAVGAFTEGCRHDLPRSQTREPLPMGELSNESYEATERKMGDRERKLFKAAPSTQGEL